MSVEEFNSYMRFFSVLFFGGITVGSITGILYTIYEVAFRK